ncbi:unnamed protein product, partial [marine sediment metagenome]
MEQDELVQEPHAGAPPIGAVSPVAPLLTAEKTDSTRCAPSWPLGQLAGSSEWLIERSNSNRV